MKTVYSGYYGAKNSGDDAFVEVASWGAKKYWRTTEHLFFASELPKIKTDAHFYPSHSSYTNFAKTVKDIFLSDTFISAGGSTFHSSLKMTDHRTYAKLKKKLSFAGKTGAIGISLGPYRNIDAEKNTIKYLKTLDFLALRDSKSYELAKSYNLPYEPIKAFDLAALLPMIYNSTPFDRIKKQKIIGVSVCNYESYTHGDLNKEENRNQFIYNVLKQLKKQKNILFRFFIFNGNSILGDEKLTLEIISKLNIDNDFNFELIPYLSNVEETFNKIEECHTVISTRLHASIFACYANVPFFLLEYHRKCTDFLEDIGQFDKYRIYDGQKNIYEVVEEIQNIMDNNSYTPPLYIEETKQRALLNFTATY